MKIEESVLQKIGWLIVGLVILFLAWRTSGAPNSPQPKSPAPLPILRDSTGPPVCPRESHPFLDLDHSRELVQGSKGLGYSCGPLSAAIE